MTAVALFALTAAGATALPCAAPTLGADLTDLSHSLRTTGHIPGYLTGALVRVVWAGGPAGRAGISAGDVIQGVGGDLVQNVCDVREAITRHSCGDVSLTIRRAQDTLVVDVRLVDADRFHRKAADDARRCKNLDGAGCTALAKRHGDDTVLLRQACDLGDAEGCFMLGLKLGNTAEGAAAYEQACDAGNPLACTNLGFAHQYGKGVPLDLLAAVRLYKRGCEGSRCSGRNNLGCVNLGRLYRDGIGVDEDQQKAIALFRDVCDRGPRPGDAEDADNVARSCSLAGTTWIVGKNVVRDVPQSLLLLEKGCAGGDPFGCFNLGTFYEFGRNVPLDKKRAGAYYQRACDRGDTEGCERLAALRR